MPLVVYGLLGYLFLKQPFQKYIQRPRAAIVDSRTTERKHNFALA